MGKEQIVLCDTNIIIELYKGNASVVKSLKAIGQENIVVSIITSGELLYGALNKRELSRISNDMSHLNVLEVSRPVCDTFMNLMMKYSLSHNLNLPDGLIAATAIAHDTPLYTLNRKDFHYIEGITMWE